MTFLVGEVEVVNEVHLAHQATIRDGAVESTDDLCISVQPFFFDLSGVHGRYPGVINQPVTDNAVNYVYLDELGALQVTPGSYPATLHIRLARVVAASGFISRIFLERAFLTASADGIAITAKSGILIPGDFSGNPKKAFVAFAVTYPNTMYTVTFGSITANDIQFVPVAENKAVTGFTVNLAVNNIANLAEIHWQAMPTGE